MKTNSLKWKGTDDEIIKLYSENKFKKILKLFKDNEDMLTMMSESNDLDTLDELGYILTLGYAYLDRIENYIKANPKDNFFEVVLALGQLRGVTQRSSRICYMKKKSQNVAKEANKAKEWFNNRNVYRSFDAFVFYLAKHEDVTLDAVKRHLIIGDKEFEKLIVKLIETNMFACRMYGSPYATIELTDDGLIYAKYLMLKEHPEDYGWE